MGARSEIFTTERHGKPRKRKNTKAIFSYPPEAKIISPCTSVKNPWLELKYQPRDDTENHGKEKI